MFRGERFLHPDLGFTLRFPKGWDTANTSQAVGATSPRRNGVVFLEHAGSGKNVNEAADTWIEEGRKAGLSIDSRKPIKLMGGDALRVKGGVRGRGGSMRILATFLTGRKSTYRIIGMSRSMSRHESLFINVARSFRRMTPELLAQVQETRVRLVEAQPDEALSDLAKRGGSDWAGLRLGIMNGMMPNHRFKGGELVKITKTEPYQPQNLAGAGPSR